MPHRLRRVVGINLRTPREDGGGVATSMRIAEMDTRGAVMAVGDNGVGKTSFLRLIPLFYGAQPRSILRGSGHTSMIRHVLPEPTSAVVYEYERGSEDDRRCVVMHADPNPQVDAPVFYIVSAGYEERFFLDGAGELVPREAFKAHVEALGIKVTERLDLANYRGVILKSVARTRESQAFRRLAEEHSLAPGPLHGLDQIAASMGPEAISFKSLQAVVVDRISQEIAHGGETRSALKKNVRDVDKWLESQKHLSEVIARQPDAQALKAQAGELEKLDHQLRELARAARDLLARRKEDKRLVTQRIEMTQQEAQSTKDALEQQAGAFRDQATGAKTDADVAAAEVQATENRLADFTRRGAESWAAKLAQEGKLRSDKLAKSTQLAEQEAAAEGVVATFQNRRTSVTNALAAEESRIQAERLTHEQATAASLKQLHEQESQALADLKPSPRLELIPGELTDANAAIGRLGEQVKNPACTPATAKDLVSTGKALGEARGQAKTRRRDLQAAQAKERATQVVRDKAVGAYERHDDLHRTAQDQLRLAQERLAPNPNSLLAYLRKHRSPEMALTARVISPDLLERTDLAPAAALAQALDNTRLDVGVVSLDAGALPDPSWLDAGEAQAQAARAQLALNAATDGRDKAAAAVTAANAALDAAQAECAQVQAASDASDGEVDRLDSDLAQLQARAEAERIESAAKATALLAAETQRRDALAEEEKQLREHFQRQGNELRKHYAGLRRTAEVARDQQTEALDGQLATARAKATEESQRIDQEEAGELAAAGVDAQALQRLRKEIADLSKELEVIERNRELVASWNEFRARDLPALPAKRQHALACAQALESALAKVKAADKELDGHIQQARQLLADLDAEAAAFTRDCQTLELLLEVELQNIPAPTITTLVQTWQAEQLAVEVRSTVKNLASQARKVDEGYQTLRKTMLAGNNGPLQDWLDRTEAEIAPLLEGVPTHTAHMRRAREITRWYDEQAGNVVNAHNADLHGMLDSAASYVGFLEQFDRRVKRVNTDLHNALQQVTAFPSFSNLDVHIRSSVEELTYIDALRKMKELSELRMSSLRTRLARNTELPSRDVVSLIRRFRDLLAAEGGIQSDLEALIRLECSLTLDGKNLRISNEDEFRKHASNGNTGMIVGMFLMGFASVVRKQAGAPVRMTWIVDEAGRFDISNVEAFLTTLDKNNIDVISARPDADPASLDLYDSAVRFGLNGRIHTMATQADTWEALDVGA